MKIKELINNYDFDCECAYVIRRFDGEETETVFDSIKTYQPPREIMDKEISYISIFNDCGIAKLIVEYNDEF